MSLSGGLWLKSRQLDLLDQEKAKLGNTSHSGEKAQWKPTDDHDDVMADVSHISYNEAKSESII